MHWRLPTVGAAVLTVLLVAACTGSGGDPAPTTPGLSSPATTSPTSSPTTSSLTPAEQDLAAAKTALVAFWRVRDELANNPTLSLTKLSTVARGQALDLHRRSLQTSRIQGLTQVGFVVVSPLSAAAKDQGTFTVVACVDVSKVNIVDQAGVSKVPPGRPAKSSSEYVVEKTPDGWYLTGDTFEAKPC